MVKSSKLYLRLLSGSAGTISFRDFEALLVAFGFSRERVRGSHRAYSHPQVARLMVVQPRGNDAKPYQVREFMDMVEDNGLGLED